MRRRILFAVVLVTGVALSLAAYHLARQDEAGRLAADFERRAVNHGKLVGEIVGNFENGLFGLHNLFVGSNIVSREEFTLAAREVRQRYKGFTALEWVPIVPGPNRAAVEAAATREIGQPFQFTTNNGARAPEAAEYMPVLYVEPLAGNEIALGYDLYHGPTTKELNEARQTGHTTVSQRIRLIQESAENRFSIILIWPFFKDFAGERRCVGFVQGIFSIADLLGSHTSQTLDVMFIDPAADAANRVIFFDSPSLGHSEQPSLRETDFHKGLYTEIKLPIGSRHWQVIYRPNEEWAKQSTTNNPAWLLLAGLFITGLLTGLMHVLDRRAETIEAEVEKQTLELKESRRQLENLMQNLPGMAFRSSYASNSQILFMSEGALALTGYTAEELMSHQSHPNKIIHPDDLDRVREKTKAAIAAKTPFEMEYRLRTRNGEEKWALSRGRGVYAESGELRFIEGLVIDITAQKTAETEKLAIERLMQEGQKLESLGILAGGVAHDFNNLLTTIMGNTGLVRQEIGANSTAKESLHQIELASKHAAMLCRQMLAYAGKGQLTKEPLDLEELVTKLQPLLKSSVGSKIDLQFEHDETVPKVYGDPTQLNQIIVNLVINAAEAMEHKAGQIILRTQVREVSEITLGKAVVGHDLPAGTYVTLEVQDHGAGMNDSTLQRIFDPFFSTKFEGRGLGLAAVAGIVRGHQGAMLVKSRPGEGTCFTLLLQPHCPEREALIPAETRQTIAMVVDDDEPIRNVTGQLLESMNYFPVLAASGLDAIELLRRYPDRFSVVLLDCVMPELSGEKTLLRLRSIRPDLPVLMMSGHNERGHNLPSGGNQIVDFITKPFTRAGLQAKLEALLAKQTTI
jgi:two-component system, cell cycle sensor histidine kinase and response regulator CckA